MAEDQRSSRRTFAPISQHQSLAVQPEISLRPLLIAITSKGEWACGVTIGQRFEVVDSGLLSGEVIQQLAVTVPSNATYKCEPAC